MLLSERRPSALGEQSVSGLSAPSSVPHVDRRSARGAVGTWLRLSVLISTTTVCPTSVHLSADRWNQSQVTGEADGDRLMGGARWEPTSKGEDLLSLVHICAFSLSFPVD